MPDFKKQAIIVTGVLALVEKAHQTAHAFKIRYVTPLTPDILEKPDNGIMSFMVSPHAISDPVEHGKEESRRLDFIHWLKQAECVEWCVVEFGIDDVKTHLVEAWDFQGPFIPAALEEDVAISDWIVNKRLTVYAPNVLEAMRLLGIKEHVIHHHHASRSIVDFMFLSSQPDNREFIKRQTNFRKWTITRLVYNGDQVKYMHVVRGFYDDGFGWLLGSNEVESTRTPEGYRLIVN